VEGIGCLHIDLDYGSSGHKSKKYPPDLETADKISKLFLQPTYLIHSGNGLHAYYFFKDYQISNLAEIEKTQEYWQKMHSIASGFNIDATHDLARILRVPGSNNCKDPENIKKGYIYLQNLDCKYDLAEFQELIKENYKVENPFVNFPNGLGGRFAGSIQEAECVYYSDNDYIQHDETLSTRYENPIDIVYDESMPKKQKIEYIQKSVRLNKNRVLSCEKFYELVDVFGPDFLSSFEHKKKMDGGGSSSEYDMSLMCYAARASLTWQEMADLMIQHRSKHINSGGLKFEHPDYYGRTIYKALESEAFERHKKNLHQKLVDNKPLSDEEVSENKKNEDGADTGSGLEAGAVPNKSQAAEEDVASGGAINQGQAENENQASNQDQAGDKNQDQDQNQKKADGQPAQPNPGQKRIAPPFNDKDREIARTYLRSELGISVWELVKYIRDPDPIFYIKLDKNGREIHLGDFKSGVLNPITFTSKISAETIGTGNYVSFKRFKSDKWNEVVNWLGRITITVLSDDTMLTCGMTRSWIKTFKKSIRVYDSQQEFIDNPAIEYGFQENNVFYFSAENFISWIKANKISAADHATLKIYLTQAGCTNDTVAIPNGETFMVWGFDETTI
jgi:hypothetical protein